MHLLASALRIYCSELWARSWLGYTWRLDLFCQYSSFFHYLMVSVCTWLALRIISECRDLRQGALAVLRMIVSKTCRVCMLRRVTNPQGQFHRGWDPLGGRAATLLPFLLWSCSWVLLGRRILCSLERVVEAPDVNQGNAVLLGIFVTENAA